MLGTGLTVPVPEELGGSGVGDAATLMVVLEHLAAGDAGITFAAFCSGAAAMLIARHGEGKHADTVARLTTDPNARATAALYEPHGRGAAEFTTTIAVTEDGQVRVKGRKVGVAFAAEADPFVVVGTDVTTGGPRAVVVPRDTAGISVQPYPGMLGLAATAAGAVDFDATVPAKNVLGSVEDSEALCATIATLRLSVAAIAIGTAQRAVEYAAEYAAERIAFGKPIAAFQGVSFPLAEAQMRVDAARLEIAEVAAALDGAESSAAVDVVGGIGRTLSYATEVAVDATRTAVQTLGGHGYIAEHPVELWYRSTTALSILDTDPLLSSFRAAL